MVHSTTGMDNSPSIFEGIWKGSIFRLEILLSDGAHGPVVFFIIPSVNVFENIDMGVLTFNVPQINSFSYIK